MPGDVHRHGHTVDRSGRHSHLLLAGTPGSK
jgi:hypothetical protein